MKRNDNWRSMLNCLSGVWRERKLRNNPENISSIPQNVVVESLCPEEASMLDWELSYSQMQTSQFIQDNSYPRDFCWGCASKGC
jgi:hypothetical protein